METPPTGLVFEEKENQLFTENQLPVLRPAFGSGLLDSIHLSRHLCERNDTKRHRVSSQPVILMYDSGMNPPRMRFRRTCLLGLFAILPLTVLLLAETGDFDGRPAVILRNDKLELTILIRGAMLANLVLRDDPEKLSPYWNMDRAQRAAGSPPARPAG